MKLLFNERRHLSVRLGTDSDWLNSDRWGAPYQKARSKDYPSMAISFGFWYALFNMDNW